MNWISFSTCSGTMQPIIKIIFGFLIHHYQMLCTFFEKRIRWTSYLICNGTSCISLLNTSSVISATLCPTLRASRRVVKPCLPPESGTRIRGGSLHWSAYREVGVDPTSPYPRTSFSRLLPLTISPPHERAQPARVSLFSFNVYNLSTANLSPNNGRPIDGLYLLYNIVHSSTIQPCDRLYAFICAAVTVFFIYICCFQFWAVTLFLLFTS